MIEEIPLALKFGQRLVDSPATALGFIEDHAAACPWRLDAPALQVRWQINRMEDPGE